jgi:FKBP-type peptidyl-prolyl cis-trans isomerase FklB
MTEKGISRLFTKSSMVSTQTISYRRQDSTQSKILEKKETAMKYLLTLIVSVVFFFGICSAGDKIELKDQKDKESYSLGYQIGQGFKKQGLDLNLDAYVGGINDALGGKEPQLSQEEIHGIVMNMQKRMEASLQKEQKEKAEKNLAAGKAFLDENRKKEGIITLPSGLQYKVLAEGSGKRPKATDTVSVRYRGTFIDGTEFDNSYKRGEPATFQVKGVIKGWSEALQLMKQGSKWQLFVPPELAYGERSVGPIPPNSTLIFEVELDSVK